MYNIVAYQQGRLKILQNKDGDFKFKCGWIILYLNKDEMKEILNFVKSREFDHYMQVKSKAGEGFLDMVNDNGSLVMYAAYDELEIDDIELNRKQTKEFEQFLMGI